MNERGTLAQLRALLAKATAAPWTVEVLDGYITGHVTSPAHDYCGNRGPLARRDSVTDKESMTRDDAYLIATMRNALPALLDVVEAARQLLTDSRRQGWLLTAASIVQLEAALGSLDRASSPPR